MKITQNP